VRRINIKISDEADKAINDKLLPYGLKGSVLGMVIEDWIHWCEVDPVLVQRYVARELGIQGVERVLVNREELLFAIDMLEALPVSLKVGVKTLINRWRKEFNADATG